MIAGGLALGLWAAARALESSRREIEATDYLRPLVAPEARPQLSVAGITLTGLGPAEEFVYAREDGLWRCPTVFGALALQPEIEALVRELTSAWGEVVAEAERAPAFGFESERPLRVRLHGEGMSSDPARDLLLEVELGASLPGLGAGRGFARLAGSRNLLELDQNPRARLVPGEERRLPPLLDERLLAGEWPERGAGLARAFLDFADGRSIDVQSRVAGASPEPGAPPPREWIAAEGEARARCLPFRIGAWQSFLYHVPYRGLSDPALAERRGLDRPQATLTLIQIDGAPIELVVGRPAPSGATFVLNRKTKLLCLLDAAEVELLLATVDMLCSTERANPWEAWLPR